MPALWATDTVVSPGAFGGKTALPNGSTMYPGQWVDSGVFRLAFQKDGNLVLLQLPDTVLWATATEDQGATKLVMQPDGNLVIYADTEALWASDTADNEGAYLSLQNDGNLVIYSFESLEKLAVWTLRPNWRGGQSETLEWMTSIAESPMAREQRMSLRISPRQRLEYSYMLTGPERTYLDLLTMATAGSPIYVPLWHDVCHLRIAASGGDTTIYVPTNYTELQTCRYAIIANLDPFTYELVEIAGYDGEAESLLLAAPIGGSWPIGTRVLPVKKCKLESQPDFGRRADRTAEVRIRFQSLEPNRSNAVSNLGIFNGNYVLQEDTNELDLAVRYDRKWFALDNDTGIPVLYDVTGFTHQEFAWFAKGRAAHWRLRGLFYTLMGRRLPLWLPSGMMDFEIVAPIEPDDTTMEVKRCGYTDMGGPFLHREYIVIQLRDGTRLYRRITAAAISGSEGETEQLALDSAPGRLIRPQDVQRISFLTFSRLDQDSVEFVHPIDTQGVTTVNAVFRTGVGYGLGDEVGPPPEPPTHDICLHDFQWFADTGLSNYANGGFSPDRLDEFGNSYLAVGVTTNLLVYGPTGVLLNTLTWAGLRTAINAWHGSAIAGATGAAASVFGNPVRQGRYVLVHTNYQISSTFQNWWVLMKPAADGSLTVVGAVYYSALLGPPYANGLRIFDVHDDATVLTYMGYFALGAFDGCFGVLPPISDFLGGTYNLTGWGGLGPCRIRTTMFYPICNNHNLSYHFYQNHGSLNDLNNNIGIILPGIGRLVMYIYFNRPYLDAEAAGGSNVCVEVHDVIQPAWPLGVMLKIPLDHMNDFNGITGTLISGANYGIPTPGYQYDNANWQLATGAPAIPFLDEYTYMSDDSVGGGDHYDHQINAIPRTNGHFWIVFIMVGFSDHSYRAGSSDPDWYKYWNARVRVFDYNPAAELAVQVYEKTCVLHHDDDFGGVSDTERESHWLIPTIVEAGGIATIHLRGVMFETIFCNFTIPT